MEATLQQELLTKIVHELPIKDINGEHVGRVDRLEEQGILLMKTPEMQGKHHYIKLDDVRSVDDLAVYLSKARGELHY